MAMAGDKADFPPERFSERRSVQLCRS